MKTCRHIFNGSAGLKFKYIHIEFIKTFQFCTNCLTEINITIVSENHI